MDSPEPPSNSTLSSGPAQDSPVFSYISNLSPIQPVEGTPAVQGFPGLNSPPLVFTSPRLNAHSRSSILKRSKFPQLSSEAFSGKNEDYHDATTDSDGTGVAVSQLRRGELSPLVQEEPDNNISVHEFLVDGSHFESTNPSIEVADNTPQPPNSAADKKESFFIFGSKEGARKNEIPKDAADVVEQAEENKGKSLPEQKDIGAYSTNTNSDLCAKVEPCFSVDCSLHRHYDDQFMDQADHTLLDIQSKPLEVAHDCIKDSDRINAMSIELDESNVPRDSQTKAGQHQSGISRRCLQFEDSQQMIAPTSSGSQNTSGSRPPVNPVVSEVVEAKSSEKIEVASSSDKIERCSAKVPKPSGIGLHLNRLVNAMQAGSGATLSLKSAEKGNLSIRGKKLTSMMSFHPLMVSSNVVESSLTSGSNHGSNTSNAESFAALSLNNAKPSNDVVLWKPTEHTSSHESSEIDNQSTSNKKRKKPSDGGGCKRCNCKKTKCLKLYCDCFAAGIYCLDSCTCQGCFNRPEYEDTVLDVRQQIQSRNPLAFAPKIVQQHPTDSPATIVGEDGASFTPSSARHKRGCNCKKSMCLKKYCECYQANVGCSNGCRCEGCQNVHGRKEEYGRDLVNIHCITEGLGTPDEDKVEKVTATSNQCNLTPLTPSFQCSNHVKTLSRSWFTSPESGQAACGLSSGSPRSSKNHDIEQETSSDVLDLVTCDQELSSGDVKLANEFSRGFYVPGNMDDLLTFQKSQDWASNSGIPLPVHFQCARPLCLTQFDGSAMNTPELLNNDKKPYVMEDETPEILKDSSILVKGVKVSSPNKKRVSPPHCHLNELGSGEGLKSGRKFILRAVPSFPPLTPCIDSKDEGTDSFVKR